MKPNAADYLIYDEESGVYRESPEQAVRDDVEDAFARAERDPSLIRELGAFLRRQGVFERYQDRFFKLVRRG